MLPLDVWLHIALLGGLHVMLALAGTCKEFKTKMDESYDVLQYVDAAAVMDQKQGYKRRGGVVGRFRYLTNVFRSHLVHMPSSVRQVRMSDYFTHSFANTLPPGLTHISCGARFNHPLDDALLPPNLKELEFGCYFSHSFERVALPDTLERVRFDGSYSSKDMFFFKRRSLIAKGFCRVTDDLYVRVDMRRIMALLSHKI